MTTHNLSTTIKKVTLNSTLGKRVEIKNTFVARQGPPGPPGVGANPSDFAREHTQNTASDTWDILHNLGYKPNIQIEDSSGDSVIPYKISHDGVNKTIVLFSGAMSGKAYLS